MELETVVRYRGAQAQYRVERDRTGIYQAYLISYDGPAESAPPPRVTLTKGIRNWVGSSSQRELMDEIGRSIETSLSNNQDIFPGQIAP